MTCRRCRSKASVARRGGPVRPRRAASAGSGSGLAAPGEIPSSITSLQLYTCMASALGSPRAFFPLNLLWFPCLFCLAYVFYRGEEPKAAGRTAGGEAKALRRMPLEVLALRPASFAGASESDHMNCTDFQDDAWPYGRDEEERPFRKTG